MKMAMIRPRVLLNSNLFGATKFLSLSTRNWIRREPKRIINDGRKLFSEVSVGTMEETAMKTEKEAARMVSRHGEGDGVITLNVGGKEFITLRSTIQNNPILHNRVMQAEKNQEFFKGAVYIDRDPTYFHLILQHLRNRADMMYNASTFAAMNEKLSKKMMFRSAGNIMFQKKDVLIQIPEKKDALRDFYVEVRYFQISELEALLCTLDLHTRFASWFGSGSGNPFYAASQAITAIRSALVATSGIGIAIGTQNEKLMENIKGLLSDAWTILRGGSPSEDSTSSSQKKENSEFNNN